MLRQERHSGISYKTVGPGSPEALLLLLHGVGGNEAQLEGLARRQDPRVLNVLARGPLAFGPQSFGWFEVRFGPQGPAIDPDQAEASRERLARLVESLQRDTGLGPDRMVIAGFSQGGIMSAGLALTRPELLRGFGLLSGRILPELAPRIAPKEALQRLSGLVTHGLEDSTLPVSWAERADAWLRELGVPFESRRYPAGHELTPAMLKDFSAWLVRTLWA
jgi:phospholipase/carboxylesterase